jgi:hypothetical protein
VAQRNERRTRPAHIDTGQVGIEVGKDAVVLPKVHV